MSVKPASFTSFDYNKPYGEKAITPFRVISTDVLRHLFQICVDHGVNPDTLKRVCRYWNLELNTACREMAQHCWNLAYPPEFDRWHHVYENQRRLTQQLPTAQCSHSEYEFPDSETPPIVHPLTLGKVAIYRETALPFVRPPLHFRKQVDVVDTRKKEDKPLTYEVQDGYAIGVLTLFRGLGDVIQGCHLFTGQHQYEIRGFRGTVENIWADGDKRLFFMTSKRCAYTISTYKKSLDVWPLSKIYYLYGYNLQTNVLKRFVFSEKIDSIGGEYSRPNPKTFCFEGNDIRITTYSSLSKTSTFYKWDWEDESANIPAEKLTMGYSAPIVEMFVHEKHLIFFGERHLTWKIMHNDKVLKPRPFSKFAFAPNLIIYRDTTKLKLFNTTTHEIKKFHMNQILGPNSYIINIFALSDSTVLLNADMGNMQELVLFDFVSGKVISTQNYNNYPKYLYNAQFNGEQLVYGINENTYTGRPASIGVLDFSAPPSNPPTPVVKVLNEDGDPTLNRITRTAQNVYFQGAQASERANIVAGLFNIPLDLLKDVVLLLKDVVLEVVAIISTLALRAFEHLKQLYLKVSA